MKSNILLTIGFGVAGLALTWYLFNKTADTASGAVDGFGAGFLGGIGTLGLGALAGSASGGNGYAGTPNHTAVDTGTTAGGLITNGLGAPIYGKDGQAIGTDNKFQLVADGPGFIPYDMTDLVDFPSNGGGKYNTTVTYN